MSAEQQIRKFTQMLVAAVEAAPDVLFQRQVRVPSAANALYRAPRDNGLSPPPKAFAHFLHVLAEYQSNPMQAIIDQLQALQGELIWGHAPGYTVDNVGQKFLDNYCHALVCGSEGPLHCAAPLGAFVLFGANTLYREHSHVPNEVYLAITDGGEWRVGEHDWLPLRAGEIIFIPSNTVHAIRTKEKPLLCFSFWLESADMESIII